MSSPSEVFAPIIGIVVLILYLMPWFILASRKEGRDLLVQAILKTLIPLAPVVLFGSMIIMEAQSSRAFSGLTEFLITMALCLIIVFVSGVYHCRKSG